MNLFPEDPDTLPAERPENQSNDFLQFILKHSYIHDFIQTDIFVYFLIFLAPLAGGIIVLLRPPASGALNVPAPHVRGSVWRTGMICTAPVKGSYPSSVSFS